MNLTANKFCLENARELAQFARMAYDEPPTIQDAGTDTQVLIRDLGDCVVVAFRGTSDLRDFITDAEAWRTETSFGEVHHGFWESWCCVRRDLYSALRGIQKPILVTGHSLGGALAMIACRQSFITAHSVYTFGAPRVGNKEFQNGYNAQLIPGSPFDTLGNATFTVVNDCDIVPRMPGYFSGYRRPGHDQFIPGVSDVSIQDPNFWFRLVSDAISLAQGWWAKRSPLFLDELLLDHHIDNYIAALNDIAPRATAQEVPA